jgi:glutaminyl-tRNA synthetase
VVLSKRKLIQLVERRPRRRLGRPAPADAGRRPPPRLHAEGFRRFAERIGVSKADSWIDMSVLEDCMRDDLNEAAERRVAVLDPLKLIIDNYPEGASELCFAPNHPLKPELGKRDMPFGRELWIEREDFMEVPSKGYHRLYPGNMARLRYGFVVKCTGCEKDADGNVTAVLANTCPTPSPAPRAPTTTRSRATCTGSPPRTPTRPRSASTTACSPTRRTPASAARAMRRTSSATSSTDINPDSKRHHHRQLEPALKDARPEDASSSSATATSSPTASTRSPARRCSTAR